MNDLLSKIADSELEILKLLWRENRKMSMPEIRKTLEPTTGWQAPTIKTLLYRLCDKGAVKAERRNNTTDKRDIYFYRAAITEKEYNDYAAAALINKLFEGSAKNLVASLIDGNRLNDDEIAELREMFKVEGGRKNV